MIARIVLAVAAGILVFLACILVGGLLATVGIPFVEVVGSFLVQWAPILGLVSAVVYFFRGGLSL